MTHSAELIDIETTQILLDALEDDFADVVNEYISNGQELISKLQELVTHQPDRLDTIKVTVHTLKGASGNIGALYLSNICQSLESDIINRSVDDIQPRVQEICNICSKTLAAFQERFITAA